MACWLAGRCEAASWASTAGDAVRALLSLAALIVAMLVVWQLAGRQAKQAVDAGTGQKTTDRTAQQIQNAMEQAAAARASEAGQ